MIEGHIHNNCFLDSKNKKHYCIVLNPFVTLEPNKYYKNL